MSQTYANNYDELTLEPMEIDLRENRLFGDFIHRDRKPGGSDKKTQAVEKPAVQQAEAAEPPKPAGKACFLVDDRRTPDRRQLDRRSVGRLTGDRRTGSTRRVKLDPWDDKVEA